MHASRFRLAALATTLSALAAGAATITPIPAQPQYGQPVAIELGGTTWPQYLPATRFLRAGGAIGADFEYVLSDFGPTSRDFGFMPIPLGELLPGQYSVQARLHDINRPTAAPQVVTAQFTVAPPASPGMYLVPRVPAAWEPASVIVRSGAYFDPATLRASVSGNVVRIDFDYAADAPVGGPAPEGYVAHAAVGIGGLAPGAYRIDGYGRATPNGVPEQFFVLNLTVGGAMQVVEYYSAALDHYFIAGGPDEIALLDAGGHGPWQRTGHGFKAWLRQADAPANARPVCRFYAAGPNSHFFTADAFECQLLKDQERTQRAEAAAAGRPFPGWAYEGIGMWALQPTSGQCPEGSEPVLRSYNNRAAANDSNHRFTRNAQLHSAMTVASADEGPQLCSPR